MPTVCHVPVAVSHPVRAFLSYKMDKGRRTLTKSPLSFVRPLRQRPFNEKICRPLSSTSCLGKLSRLTDLRIAFDSGLWQANDIPQISASQCKPTLRVRPALFSLFPLPLYVSVISLQSENIREKCNHLSGRLCSAWLPVAGVSVCARDKKSATRRRRFMAFNMGTLNQCSDLLLSTGRRLIVFQEE